MSVLFSYFLSRRLLSPMVASVNSVRIPLWSAVPRGTCARILGKLFQQSPGRKFAGWKLLELSEEYEKTLLRLGKESGQTWLQSQIVLVGHRPFVLQFAVTSSDLKSVEHWNSEWKGPLPVPGLSWGAMFQQAASWVGRHTMRGFGKSHFFLYLSAEQEFEVVFFILNLVGLCQPKWLCHWVTWLIVNKYVHNEVKWKWRNGNI